MKISFDWNMVKVFIVLLAMLTFVAQGHGAEDKQKTVAAGISFHELPELDSRFQEGLNIYLSSVSKSELKGFTFGEIVDAVNTRRDSLAVLELIRSNQQVILRSASDRRIFEVLDFLYKKNDTATVQKISNVIKNQGTPHFRATNFFLLAKYYHSRGNWKGVRAALTNIDKKELSSGDLHYFSLLMGYSLQQLKEHRKAYGFYQSIPASSPYYIHAKLNESTAYLRQGWWTEAHLELKKAIESLENNNDTNLKDRLYTVLGYSQLHYEFYRDARDTLRNVTLQSEYTNKALMGLGLSAAYQKDYLGAINAFKLLSDKTPKDINVDEVKLLLAKAFDEVGDVNSATEAYQRAVVYYQLKLARLENVLRQLRSSNKNEIGNFTQQLQSQSLEIYGSQNFIPEYFYENYTHLLDMQEQRLSKKSKKLIDDLQVRYQKQLVKMVSENIQLRQAMVNSYLSQAKFGMARLYDKK